LLIEFGKMLRTPFLLDVELLLGALLVTGPHIGLSKPIVRVSQIGILGQSLHVFRNRRRVLLLIGIEIA
jgi:hypothetical protein